MHASDAKVKTKESKILGETRLDKYMESRCNSRRRKKQVFFSEHLSTQCLHVLLDHKFVRSFSSVFFPLLSNPKTQKRM